MNSTTYRRRTALVRAVMALSLTLAAGSALAATLDVPAQYPTIQSAVDAAAPGDTVQVAPGRYTEEDLRMRDRVSVVGAGAAATFLTGTTSIVMASDLVFEGFTVEGRTLQVEAASPTIRNNVIRYSPGFAIDARFFSWATIDHNVIYNNSGGIRTSAAWYNEPGFATIVNNTIVDNFGTSGIYNASETFPASNNLVYRNYNGITATTSRAGGYNLIYGSYYRDWFQRAPGEVYANPVLANVPRTMAQTGAWGTALDTLLVTGLPYGGTVLVGDHVEVAYDKVDRVVTEVVSDASGTRFSFSPPLAAAPADGTVLVWGATSDFAYDLSLRPGSPAIDAGDPALAYLDLDGSRNDIGATGGRPIAPVHEGIPPAAVAATATGGDSQILLTWPPSPEADVTGYLVLRSETGPVEAAPVNATAYAVWTAPQTWPPRPAAIGNAHVVAVITNPATASYLDADRYPGVTFHYAVVAYDRFFNYAPPAAASAAATHAPRTWVVSAAGGGDFAAVGPAIAAAKAGDTVLVQPGTYREALALKEGVRVLGASRDGSVIAYPAGASALVSGGEVYRASLENLTLLDDDATPETAGSAAVSFRWGSAPELVDVTVRGFGSGASLSGESRDAIPTARQPRIVGCSFESNGTGVYLTRLSGLVSRSDFVGHAGSAIYLKYFASPEISDNRFLDNAQGINVWENSQPLVRANLFERNGQGMVHAWSSHSTVEGNVFRESGQYGIYAVSYSSPLIRNNVFAKGQGDALWLFLNWPRAYDNTIVENAGHGITSLYYSSVDVRNNVIAFNGGYGTYAGEPNMRAGYPYLRYNCVFGNGLGATSPWSAVLEGNLFVDPLLRDRAGGDYRLAAGSPCIDAGDPDPAFNDPNGTRNDVGAWGGPSALPGGEPPIPEQITSVATTIIVFPDASFKNEAANRKSALENKLQAIVDMVAAAESLPPAERRAVYEVALSKLEDDILAKADGWFGGNPKNDWIVTRDAQAVVVPIVKDLVTAVRALIASVPG